MRKIAVCSDGDTLNSRISTGFGNSAYIGFITWDESHQQISQHNFVPNQHSGKCGGLVGMIAKEGVETILVDHIGQIPVTLFGKKNISVYYASGLSVDDAVTEYFSKKLSPISSATCSGHSLGKGQCQGQPNHCRGKNRKP